MSSSSKSSTSHGRRIAAITIIGTAIVLPLVIFVLGPNMPPGKATEVAKGQVTDNTVLLVVMTPFTVFILGYLGYAIAAFRAPKGESELRTARRCAATCPRRSHGS